MMSCLQTVESRSRARISWLIYAMYLQGKANIEMTTSRRHTPLLVAVSAGECHVIELLVNRGNYTLADNNISFIFRP